MYLIGGPHPNKIAAEQALARVAGTERLITNAEVLQEIVRRYAALERRDGIQTAFEVVLKLVEEVLPVTLEIVQHAKTLTLGHRRLSSRDALHLATRQAHGVTHILTLDADFDRIAGITRIAG